MGGAAGAPCAGVQRELRWSGRYIITYFATGPVMLVAWERRLPGARRTSMYFNVPRMGGLYAMPRALSAPSFCLPVSGTHPGYSTGMLVAGADGRPDVSPRY